MKALVLLLVLVCGCCNEPRSYNPDSIADNMLLQQRMQSVRERATMQALEAQKELEEMK